MNVELNANDSIRFTNGLREEEIPYIFKSYPRPIYCRIKETTCDGDYSDRLIHKYYSIGDDKYIGKILCRKSDNCLLEMQAVRFNEFGNPVSKTIWSYKSYSVVVMTNPSVVKDPTATGVDYAYVDYDFQTTEQAYYPNPIKGYCEMCVNGSDQKYSLFGPAFPPIPDGYISIGEAAERAIAKSNSEEEKKQIAIANRRMKELDEHYKELQSNNRLILEYVNPVYEKQLVPLVYKEDNLSMLPRLEAEEEIASGISRKVCQFDFNRPMFIEKLVRWHYTIPGIEKEYSPGTVYPLD